MQRRFQKYQLGVKIWGEERAVREDDGLGISTGRGRGSTSGVTRTRSPRADGTEAGLQGSSAQENPILS